MKPYLKAQKIRLDGLQDRRRRLTDKDKEKIREMYASGEYSQMSLARLYRVSKSLIGITVNPERAERVKRRGKEHWREYYEKHGKAYHAAMIRNVRNYKYGLMKDGRLKES